MDIITYRRTMLPLELGHGFIITRHCLYEDVIDYAGANSDGVLPTPVSN